MYDFLLLGCDRLLNCWLVDVNGWISKLSVSSCLCLAEKNSSHSEGEMKVMCVKNWIFGLFRFLKTRDANRINHNSRG